MAKRPSLGRGLAALLPAAPVVTASDIQEIPLSQISSNPYQPRLKFPEAELDELAESIGRHGVLQPILVTPTATGFQLVAGERRVLASRRAGRETIPAQIRQLDDRTVLAVALVENVQRAELDPIEKARALARLREEFGATQEELAQEIGVSRAQVANLLRLLALPSTVQEALQAGDLSLGHAKVLLGLPETELPQYAATAMRFGWSVRELEEGVRQGWIDGPPMTGTETSEDAAATKTPRAPKAVSPADPDIVRLEKQLAERFGTPCALKLQGKRGGTLSFQIYSWEDADRLIRRLLQADERGNT
ncbi:MAG: Stage 0 sporulation protein J [bacterium]|nr:Stage 0 sporulation protein J [bacterium]